MKDIVQNIRGREILNARGKPTVEAELITSSGICVTASVPSGTSTGKYEAFELYDGDKRYGGYGTRKAAANISGEIFTCLKGMELTDLKAIDKAMCILDGTPNKSRLGANAILAVSVAAAKAGAASAGVPTYQWLGQERGKYRMPHIIATVISGGAFSPSGLEFEDYIVIFDGFSVFSDELEALVNLRQALEKNLRAKYGNFPEDGGALAAPLSSSREAFEFMLEAARQTGIEKNVTLGLDVAASELYCKNTGLYQLPGHANMNREELTAYYCELCQDYPLRLIEDGFEEDDYAGFRLLKKSVPGIQIVGDDLFVTSISRLKKGLELDCANAMLLKINQVGTVTEAIEAGRFAQDNGYDAIVSLRSGETTDDFVADLAVGIGARQFKPGSPVRAERNVKYNRLLKISDELGL
jgi:enolase